MGELMWPEATATVLNASFPFVLAHLVIRGWGDGVCVCV